MEKELPKIDLPEPWLIGTDISKELLSLYTNYPVRLKCEIFVLCMDGEVDASVNLNRIAPQRHHYAYSGKYLPDLSCGRESENLFSGLFFQIH